jgi:hypothetical protein
VHTTLTDSAAPIRRWLIIPGSMGTGSYIVRGRRTTPRTGRPATAGVDRWAQQPERAPARGQFPPAAVAVSSTDTVSAP